MSPSRGSIAPSSDSEPSTETNANIRSSSALTSAKRNLHYLFAPDSPNAPHPAHLRTRALLRSLRFIGIFIFWRIVRYAKYALVGSIVAAVGASALGGAASGAAFVLAPPTIASSLGVGLIWMMGKWAFRKMRVAEKIAVNAEGRVKTEAEGVRRDGGLGDVQGPGAVPW
jgi:hypothetical protein